jgi:hypothetical protein
MLMNCKPYSQAAMVQEQIGMFSNRSFTRLRRREAGEIDAGANFATARYAQQLHIFVIPIDSTYRDNLGKPV